ncbi:sulfotransferase [Pseudomonas sp. PSE14]|uniref:sulfotransferase family protein n=1 Tax=Pseudomonas sp. PSE14 TaxID=3016341 RepID=UPI0023D8B289|nr:sulfotransferase [Pseudomonas sp. PSE14]WEJ70759.1 sulfotransferase [Pseudomonas sp. PSE14]
MNPNVHHPEKQGAVTLVFVIHGGPLEAKSAVLAASLRARLGFDHRLRIIAAVVMPDHLWGALSPSTEQLLRRLEIECLPIESPFGVGYPIGNKFAALALGGADGHCLFLDSDMYCRAAPDFAYLQRYEAALKPADLALVSTSASYWGRLYALVGLALPEARVVASLSGDLMPPYFNAGFIWVHGPAEFAQQWQRIAREIEAATDIDYKWPWLDQLALPLALAHMQRHTEVLSDRYNYPLHLKPLDAGNDPYFCHYHDPEVLAREPALLRDLQTLQSQWPELTRTLELYPAWRQVCSDIKAVLCPAPVAQEANSEGTNLIITGLPRSGTSFLCRLLSERPQTVVINEPAQIFQSLTRGEEPWGIPCFYAELRREILAGRPVLNKHLNGRLVDDTAREQDIALPYQVSSPVPGFTLGTKNTLAYLVRLPALLRVMPKAKFIALVRHPYDCLASWVSTFKHLRNADLVSQPLGNPDDPALSERSRLMLREIADVSHPALRRALWWRFLVIQLLEAGPRVRWMRYEDLVAAPEKMTALLLSQEPLPALEPVPWRKELPPTERDLVAGVLRDVAERLQYTL